MDQGGKWVEDSIYNSNKVIWTNSNVLWDHKFTHNVPDYDEWNLMGFNQQWRSSEFLVIGLERIKMEKENVQKVLNWLALKGVKDVQKFLRLTNYYWWFIRDFTVIDRQLHDLVKKDQK